MSGHSKWAQIKYKKGATDAKRGKIFSKLARMITVAAKEAGQDPKINFRLLAAIDEARRENMPNDNISRAIKRAAEKESEELKEVVYEAYGPGGSALVIMAVTDNSNRTTNEIKHLLSEHGAKLGEQGSAMWAFNKQGKDFVAKFPTTLSEDDSKKFESLLSALDDHDDVQEVYSNAQL
ncbi:MAG: YebC/PmpR family DNA-binding transcriptional regulator, partial [Candidatus Giovannonibacteria bacterium]|nr:YebC/PmpR family DNA-binding transcriptional regulator [Candidatus Giovannonibacteria bacterium]